MLQLEDLIARARAGDLDAYGQVVQATQRMAHAVARGVLRDPSLAEDAVQEAYLRAFRRLRDLGEPAAFVVWLRRIVVTTALNVRRTHRHTFVSLDDAPEVPVLDEEETSWSEQQRQRLAGALLTLSPEERRLCDRRYHGRWSTARLAREAGVEEAAVRKRLQRIRDRLRKEMEVSEQRDIRPEDMRQDLPAKVVELLARPQLTDLPDNPVGSVLEQLRAAYADFEERTLPEIVDFREASKSIGDHVLYVAAGELHRVDERTRLDRWVATSRVLKSADALFPGRQVKIVPTHFPMCSQAWELEIEDDGRWIEALAWGVFSDRVARHLGADPQVHTAVGVGHGLERLAMLRYRIDDIRR